MSEYLIHESDMVGIADAIREKTGKTDKISFDNMVSEISGISTGVELNFEVVGNPQPENPKENTIWVNTDEKITGWNFSATEPEAPEEGMVWFITGANSNAAFNALKNNGIHVYFLQAKQYVSGEWVFCNSSIFKDGNWAVAWGGEIYDSGNEYELFTGGIEIYKAICHSYGGTSSYATKDAASISLSAYRGENNSANSWSFLYTKNKMPLGAFSKLAVTVSSASAQGVSLYVSNEVPYHTVDGDYKWLQFEPVAQAAISGAGNWYLDISDIQEAYVVVGVNSPSATDSSYSTVVTKLKAEA